MEGAHLSSPGQWLPEDFAFDPTTMVRTRGLPRQRFPRRGVLLRAEPGPFAAGGSACRGFKRIRRDALACACSQGGQLAGPRGDNGRGTTTRTPSCEPRLHPPPRALPSSKLWRGSGCRRTRVLLSLPHLRHAPSRRDGHSRRPAKPVLPEVQPVSRCRGFCRHQAHLQQGAGLAALAAAHPQVFDTEPRELRLHAAAVTGVRRSARRPHVGSCA